MGSPAVNGVFRGRKPVRAIVDIAPASPVVIMSPIAGDPDTGSEQSISGFIHIVTGFLLPRPGIVTEVHMICQGNTGTGVGRNVRCSICSVVPEPAASAGLKHNTTLYTGLTSVADNVAGDVTLLSGGSVDVPSQFVVAIKAPFKSLPAEQINVQNAMSAGPVPGVVGTTQFVSAATYIFNTTDFADPPGQVVPGDYLLPSGFKGLSVYIKWKAA